MLAAVACLAHRSGRLLPACRTLSGLVTPPRWYERAEAVPAEARGDGVWAARAPRLPDPLPCPPSDASTSRPIGQGGGHAVVLDGRPVNTPARRPLVLPTRLLALAVAAEWQWQVCEY